MSLPLHFPQDQQSKREKQEMFKRSLDDQRRLKQRPSAQQHQLPDDAGLQGHHVFVPGLAAAAATLPDAAVNVPRLNHIPGLDQQVGYAPRFEGSPSPPQEKQPYMSALSEMNGRPLHIRQQQFQKESHYRNMLKDQIAENKKRKDAEKAKLDEEKRRELEEVRRLQGIPAPRRQQHKQFQESPDHPLPSPGRLPPAVHNPAAHPQLQRPGGSTGLQNYDQSMAVTPVHAASVRNPPGIHGLDAGGRRQGQRNLPTHHQDCLAGDRSGVYSERQQQTSVYPNELASNGRHNQTFQTARTAAPSRPSAGDNQGAGAAGRPLDRFSVSEESHGGEGAARKLAFERGGARCGDGGATPFGQAENTSDSVPRADFDELSSLCRDLLHEQKQLRQRLEEREERERLAAERSAQQEEATRRHRPQQHDRQQQRGVPRRGGGRTPGNQGRFSGSGDERRRAPSVRETALRHDHRPKPKPGVAFGSSRPRMPGPTVDKPRVVANPKPRASGGGHDRRIRVSKSEPVPAIAAGTSVDMRHRHTTNAGATSRGGSSGNGEKLYTNREPSDSGWPSRNMIQGADGGATGAGSGRFAGADRDRAVGGAWTSDEKQGLESPELLHVGGGGNSTIHSLLRNAGGAGQLGVGSRETEARTNGDGGDELGGESTFLAARTMHSGF